jgi:hypothetical protein
MIEILHIDDTYHHNPSSFHELQAFLSSWGVSLIPQGSFSEAAVDAFLGKPDSSRCLLLDIRDQQENQGRGGAILEKFHDLCSIVLFSGDDGAWSRLKGDYGGGVAFVSKPMLGTRQEIESTGKQILSKLPSRVRAEIRAGFATDFVNEQLGSDF